MEHQVQYAVNAAMKLQKERLKSIEPKPEAVADFDEWIEDYFPTVSLNTLDMSVIADGPRDIRACSVSLCGPGTKMGAKTVA